MLLSVIGDVDADEFNSVVPIRRLSWIPSDNSWTTILRKQVHE